MASRVPRLLDPVPEIASYLRSRVAACAPDVAIVCGSGLSGLADAIEGRTAVAYEDIPHFPHSTVAGHGTELVFGTLHGVRVVAQRGRFHAYEGWPMSAVTLPIRVFAALGVRVLVVTNAAGGVNAEYRVGDVMVINDHVSLPSLSGLHPLIGPNDKRFGPRFPPLSTAYSPLLQALAAEVAKARGLGACLRSGVYFHDTGPTYETPSEIRAMRVLGGDAVGMSTVPEVIVASHAGMGVLGLSLITNQCLAPGDTGIPPSHEEVLEATRVRALDMQGLVAAIVARIPLDSFTPPPVASVLASADRGGGPPPPLLGPAPPTGTSAPYPMISLPTLALVVAAATAVGFVLGRAALGRL